MEALQKKFSIAKGLQQGDPLVSFLFITVAEGFSGLMREAKSLNLFKGYFVGKDKGEANLLQYADDTLFVGEASLENVTTIKTIMRCFEVVPDFKVNFHKSPFGVVGGDRGEVETFVDFFNFRTTSLAFFYLGIPIEVNHWKEDTWRPIIDKFHKKLSTCKHRHLSFANIVCIINLVLSCLYLFSFYPFLKLHGGC